MSQSISVMKPLVDDLSRSSNNIYNYVNSMSSNLRERQRVVNGEKPLLTLTTHTTLNYFIF